MYIVIIIAIRIYIYIYMYIRHSASCEACFSPFVMFFNRILVVFNSSQGLGGLPLVSTTSTFLRSFLALVLMSVFKGVLTNMGPTCSILGTQTQPESVKNR